MSFTQFLVHSISQYAWKVMISLSFIIYSLILLNFSPPFHFPDVRGWNGFAVRAHVKIFLSKGRLAS